MSEAFIRRKGTHHELNMKFHVLKLPALVENVGVT